MEAVLFYDTVHFYLFHDAPGRSVARRKEEKKGGKGVSTLWGPWHTNGSSAPFCAGGHDIPLHRCQDVLVGDGPGAVGLHRNIPAAASAGGRERGKSQREKKEGKKKESGGEDKARRKRERERRFH